MAAVLGAGVRSALSHTSAAAHWGLPGFRTRPLHVTRQRDGAFADEDPVVGTVHTARVLPDSHLVRWHGVDVTAPTRTLFDLAPQIHPQRLERLLDRAGRSARHRPAPASDPGRARRAGPTGNPADAGVDLRSSGRPSAPGERAREPVRAAPGRRRSAADGAPGDVGSDSWIGRVDFLDRSARLVVEIDGDRFHGSGSDRRDDACRTAELQAAGWRVPRCTAFEIWHRPRDVQHPVRAAPGSPPSRASPRTSTAGWDR